jgi:hypothetical protein
MLTKMLKVVLGFVNIMLGYEDRYQESKGKFKT